MAIVGQVLLLALVNAHGIMTHLPVWHTLILAAVILALFAGAGRMGGPRPCSAPPDPGVARGQPAPYGPGHAKDAR
jgi:hypothetical protein